MKYIVSISGGAGSTIAAHRAVEAHGPENVVLVFADTNSEDGSLYDVISHMQTTLPGCKRRWINNQGQDIWDVFIKTGVMRLPKGGCKASRVLKQYPIDRFVDLLFTPVTAVRVSGLAYDEFDRREKLDARLAPYRVWHPLADRPRLNACEQISEMYRLGYPTQTLYDKGYPHNNCGGGCILAGQGQWAGLLKDNPAKYFYCASREREFQERWNTDFTVLKDRRGGTTKSLTLYEFAERIQSGDTSGLRDFRSTCACMTGDD